MLVCRCNKWIENWPKIEAQKYDGAIFKFCPFCGKELIESEDKAWDEIIEEVLEEHAEAWEELAKL